MKSITLSAVLMVLIALGCKKQDNTNNSTTIDVDTSQFVSWNMSGDSFNNTQFYVKTDRMHVTYNILTADNTETGFYYGQNGVYSVAVGIRVEGIAAGTYPINYFSNVLLDLEGAKGYSTILGKTGQITLTHFAKDSNEYFSGTFSGEFALQSDTSQKFSAKNGKFRIKRQY